MPSRSATSRSRSYPNSNSKYISSVSSSTIPARLPPSTLTPTYNIKHETPSLFSSIKSGFGFAIGNRIASNIMGSSHNDTPFDNKRISSNNCEDIKKIYDRAIENASLTEDIRKAYDKCIQ